jgi:hypothetical protein
VGLLPLAASLESDTMNLIVEPGFIQFDIPLSGGMFELVVGFYLLSFAVKLVVTFIKSLPFL